MRTIFSKNIDGLEDFTFGFAEWLFHPGYTDEYYEATLKIDKQVYDYLFIKFYDIGENIRELKTEKDYGEPFSLNTPFGKIILEKL